MDSLDAPTTSTASSYSNGLEARFRLRLFALLRNPPDSMAPLFAATNSGVVQSAALRLDLGRFLAAYFLNFDMAALFAHHGELPKEHTDRGSVPDQHAVLPNLLLWSELDEQWQAARSARKTVFPSSNGCWDRAQLGQLLSAECSPGLALHILLRERRVLEAIFLADHFNDARAAMALRFLSDRTFGTNLFPVFCHQIIVDRLLEAIVGRDEFTNDGNAEEEEISSTERRIQLHVEAALQADVLFADEFASCTGPLTECVLTECAQLMAAQFSELLRRQECEDKQEALKRLLPRPPIYSVPLGGGNSPRDSESLAWVRLHRCYLAISFALARANRLDQLIGFFALWLAQSQAEGGEQQEDELLEAQCFAGQTEEEVHQLDLDVFQTLFCVVLGMDLRDKVAHRQQMMAQNGKEPENEQIRRWRQMLALIAEPFLGIERRYVAVKQPVVWTSLKRWARLAESTDLDGAALFLHTMQQRNQPARRFLPPLNAQSRPKWYSLLVADIASDSSSHQARRHQQNALDVFPGDEHKFKLTPPDLLRLRYLAYCFPLIPLRPPLIQMLLHLEPHEFCFQIDPLEEERAANRERNGTLETVLENIVVSHQQSQNGSSGKVWSNLVKQHRLDNSAEGRNEIIFEESAGKQVANQKPDGNFEQLEVLAEQIRASIRNLELLEQEQLEEETKARKAEEKAQFEVETSSEHWEEDIGKVLGKGRTQKADRWRRRTSAGVQQNSSQSEKERRTRALAAFMRTKLARDGQELASGRSSSSATPAAFSSSTTPSSSARTQGRLMRGALVGTGRDGTASERESAFESMAPSPVGNEEEDEEEEADVSEDEAEKATDEQLEKEMNEIGQRLDWIWGHFRRRKDLLVDEDAEDIGRGREEEGSGEAARKASIKWIEEGEEDNHQLREEAVVDEKINLESQKLNFVDKNHLRKVPEAREVSADEEAGKKPAEQCHHQSSTEEFVPSARVPSSAGYHSSVSSAAVSGRTRHVEEDDGILARDKKGRNKGGKGGGGEMPSEWLRPANVEPMDFSRLASSDSEEEGVPGNHTMKTKKKAMLRQWSEIEVFPRNSPVKKASSPAPVQQCQQRIAPKKVEKKRTKEWKVRQWLRLLPPFDGAIRTERPVLTDLCAAQQRPLLQLRLEGLDALASSSAVTGIAGTSRRTFLDMAAKEVTNSKMKKHQLLAQHEAESLAQEKRKTAGPKDEAASSATGQIQQQTNTVYDSGIGLDQQQTAAVQWSSNNDGGVGGMVLYSAELDAQEIEQMRRMAGRVAENNS